jgi:hypothetical protein
MSFGRPSRSLLAGVPDLLDRATLFRSPRLPAALYGIVLALLVAAAGCGLVLALRAAEDDGLTAAGEHPDTDAAAPVRREAGTVPGDAARPDPDGAPGDDDVPASDGAAPGDDDASPPDAAAPAPRS